MEYVTTFWNRFTDEIMQQRRKAKTIELCKRDFLRNFNKEDLSSYNIFICDNLDKQDFFWNNIHDLPNLTKIDYACSEFLAIACNCGIIKYKALYRKEGLKK